MGFSDHFSSESDRYKAFRPEYPEALFKYLHEQSPSGGLVWDCGTGNGQAALALAELFSQVVATDASDEQISQTPQVAGIDFRVATAEASGLAASSVDLITVAQAFHWFDLPKFYEECRRVAKPNAKLAIWTYKLANISSEVDPIVERLHRDIVGPYWPPERNLVESGYAGIKLPFAELKTPDFAIEAEWDLPHLLGYLRTWSASKRYQLEIGEDAVTNISDELAAAWGNPSQTKLVSWPMPLRLFTITIAP
jgi:SAM-dependent methyltransferase